MSRRRLCVEANADQVAMMAASKAEKERAARESEEWIRRVLEEQLSEDGSTSEKGEFDDVFDDWANPLGL